MMKRYRINKTTTFVEDNHSGNKEKYLIPDYKVQVKFAWIWITVNFQPQVDYTTYNQSFGLEHCNIR